MTVEELDEWRVKCFGWNGEEFHEEPFRQFCELMKEENDDAELEKAMELYAAGWKSECPLGQKEIMSWFWRRPGPRGGRLFKSTDQALSHLRRDRK